MALDPSASLKIVSALRGKRASQLRDWWSGLARAGHAPSKADFKLADWKAHLPWITAADTVRDAEGRPVDVVFKVFGTALVGPFGGDLSGTRLSQIGEPFFERWITPVRLVDSTREPVLATGRILTPAHDFQEFDVVFVPLFDSSGDIERLLVEAELVSAQGAVLPKR